MCSYAVLPTLDLASPIRRAVCPQPELLSRPCSHICAPSTDHDGCAVTRPPDAVAAAWVTNYPTWADSNLPAK